MTLALGIGTAKPQAIRFAQLYSHSGVMAQDDQLSRQHENRFLTHDLSKERKMTRSRLANASISTTIMCSDGS